MGKNKLQKFEDMDSYPHVFQYHFSKINHESFELKGRWNEKFFHNDNPIVLELGCGKGEYTVGLGKLFPQKNFIGVDIKGARMWTGAKESLQNKMKNVAFLRTSIELIDYFFSENEISEIWLTFPDPQMKKTRKRLTSTRFMSLYQKIMKENGVIHLKTDSSFLYTYTCLMAKQNDYKILFQTDDLYHSNWVNDILSIQTFYEQQWIERGLNIKYIQFELTGKTTFIEPEDEIEYDSYRSFNRSKRSGKTNNINE